VRSLLLGKTPIATPTPGKHYVGPDGKTYPTGILAAQMLKNIKLISLSQFSWLAMTHTNQLFFHL
jgi:hypothetical protein